MSTPIANPSKVLFVTGRLAEFALRRVVEEVGPQLAIEADIAVLPISVAALMSTRWVARHLTVPEGTDRVILPGYCQGDLEPIRRLGHDATVERGPQDLRDLPAFLGRKATPRSDYGAYDIEILAEINHAPLLTRAQLLEEAATFANQGADRIDLGCDPDGPWSGVGDAVRALRDQGHRVSIDSFDPTEVRDAVEAGADLVLSVNRTNRERAPDWGVEVVAIPDIVGTLDGLEETIDYLEQHAIRYRVDPILEPIGFGFAASLGRYLEFRRRHPTLPMMMGIGNLTELTDVDSAGINLILTAFCQELNVGSVLTTSVINWARTSVREIDLARRLTSYSVKHRTLPKHVEPGLVVLRDSSVPRFGPEGLEDIRLRIKDPNWRLFAEDGRLVAMNNQHMLSDEDPFLLFEQMDVHDASHAFYLGYELMKARTALTLNKAYRQDQSLDWGYLTVPEVSHRERKRDKTPEGERTP